MRQRGRCLQHGTEVGSSLSDQTVQILQKRKRENGYQGCDRDDQALCRRLTIALPYHFQERGL
jgi:hypothetical protein